MLYDFGPAFFDIWGDKYVAEFENLVARARHAYVALQLLLTVEIIVGVMEHICRERAGMHLIGFPDDKFLDRGFTGRGLGEDSAQQYVAGGQ